MIVGVMMIVSQRTKGHLVWIDDMDHQEVVMMMVTMTIVVHLVVMMVDGEDEMKEGDGQVETIVVDTETNPETMMTTGVVMIVHVTCRHYTGGAMRTDEML